MKREKPTLAYYAVLYAITLICSIACGGNVSQEEAVEMCEDFLDTYCIKKDDCSFFTDREECISSLKTEIDCGAAVDVSDSYDRCIEDLESSTCNTFTFDELPASCKEVILTR